MGNQGLNSQRSIQNKTRGVVFFSINTTTGKYCSHYRKQFKKISMAVITVIEIFSAKTRNFFIQNSARGPRWTSFFTLTAAISMLVAAVQAKDTVTLTHHLSWSHLWSSCPYALAGSPLNIPLISNHSFQAFLILVILRYSLLIPPQIWPLFLIIPSTRFLYLFSIIPFQ